MSTKYWIGLELWAEGPHTYTTSVSFDLILVLPVTICGEMESEMILALCMSMI